MSLVWELPWPAEPTLLALAVADYANDQGQGIFPTIETAARKSRLSERSVQRFFGVFRELGLLVPVKKATRRTPTVYKLDVALLRGWADNPTTCPSWPGSTWGRAKYEGRHGDTPAETVGCHGVAPDVSDADEAQGRQGVTSEGCHGDTPDADVGCLPRHLGVTPTTIQGCQGDTQNREEQNRQEEPSKERARASTAALDDLRPPSLGIVPSLPPELRGITAVRQPIPPFDQLELPAALRVAADEAGCSNPDKAWKHWHTTRWATRSDHRTWRTDWLADFEAWLLNHDRYGCPCQTNRGPSRGRSTGNADSAMEFARRHGGVA